MNTEDQQSKIALVTGGGRGIGKSIALNAAKRGIGVILTYNTHPEGRAKVFKNKTGISPKQFRNLN